MNHNTKEELFPLVDQAVMGDGEALEKVVLQVQDMVFNLSLRMLGSFSDAEDATQDILVKVITHLSSFKKESLFSTWVFSIAANYLKTYRKHRFANMPLTFDFYGEDIDKAKTDGLPDATQNVDKELLAEELKLSCTNVLLQCLDPQSRCIFILGTMFRLDSRVAGEIFGLTPEAYRQRLSRIRKKVAGFLKEYCGEYGQGKCKCIDRVNYAIHSHRIHPLHLEYSGAGQAEPQDMTDVKEAMEELDDLAQEFAFLKAYESPEHIRQALQGYLESAPFAVVKKS